MNLKKLSEPFPPNDIEWRIGQSGMKNGKVWAMALAYVTSRAIMERLDDVCGPGGWQNQFTKAPDGGTLCGISIKVDDEWITKWDGAENTNIEAVKGGLSGSMKRAGVQWGIGRYLYKLDASFVNCGESGTNRGTHIDNKSKQRTYYKWTPPQLPSWALPPQKQMMTPEQSKKLMALVDDILDAPKTEDYATAAKVLAVNRQSTTSEQFDILWKQEELNGFEIIKKALIVSEVKNENCKA